MEMPRLLASARKNYYLRKSNSSSKSDSGIVKDQLEQKDSYLSNEGYFTPRETIKRRKENTSLDLADADHLTVDFAKYRNRLIKMHVAQQLALFLT
ncbi:hypothetical protein OESDEN_13305 [Oesophagostomum dentatum]|uniref:Uncharacterized protein n=1 Tax=Oesophagostomum dentatum TaxID=61180 RepID=A0A0B1SSQ7_OESDE|nr:hypothetical protein OESDEN_13305 [Oesophagostomum dentatum]